MDAEPETEDCDTFDDQKLAQQFYKYFINPDWLTIRRIISHRQSETTKKEKEYFVMWRDLSYSECTWELESRTDMHGLAEQIEKYWAHRDNIMKEKKKKDKNKQEKCKL